MTELSEEECEWLNEMAEREGLCCNCFHTLECCGGACATMNDPNFNPWAHVCDRVGQEVRASCQS